MRPQQSETPTLVDSRQAIRNYYLADEHKVISEMIAVSYTHLTLPTNREV